MRHDGERERIDGWKAIAWMLGRNERTVMRWEMTRSLPIYRVPGAGKSSVFAYRGELNAWIAGGGAPPSTVDAPGSAGPPGDGPGAKRAGRVLMWLGGGVLALGAATALALSARGHARIATVARAITLPPAAAQTDPDTLALYLSGRYYWNIRTPAAIGKAVTAYGQAIARDPRYAPAYAGLADCFLLMREYGTLPDTEAFPKAEAAAEAALALDPGLASGARARAFVRYWWHRDRTGGLAAFRAAIALAPDDAQSHYWYATALAAAADHRAALTEIDTARRLDPDSPSILADRGLILFQAGRSDEAKAALEGVVADTPRQMSAHAWLAEVLLARGDCAGFLREKLIAARLRRDAVTEALFVPGEAELAKHGRKAMLTAVAGRAERAFAGGHLSAVGVAQLEAMAGNAGRARALMQIAANRREVGELAAPADRWLASVGIRAGSPT